MGQAEEAREAPVVREVVVQVDRMDQEDAGRVDRMENNAVASDLAPLLAKAAHRKQEVDRMIATREAAVTRVMNDNATVAAAEEEAQVVAEVALDTVALIWIRLSDWTAIACPCEAVCWRSPSCANVT